MVAVRAQLQVAAFKTGPSSLIFTRFFTSSESYQTVHMCHVPGKDSEAREGWLIPQNSQAIYEMMRMQCPMPPPACFPSLPDLDTSSVRYFSIWWYHSVGELEFFRYHTACGMQRVRSMTQ
jgi:hypothetical protein